MTGDPEGDPDEFIAIARYDWLTTRRWRYLHGVRDQDWTETHRVDIAECWAVCTPVRLACGRIAHRLYIPGVFSRGGFGGGLPRCLGCCRALGGPPGNGSPKNSAAWRVILGLDTAGAGGTGT